ncbi:hypothetical protein TRIUR3_25226 [Triticum urartu]|uniref:Uncharacterized protein n=1 Tax=Triticum urartu TaxID=4572 RepID=M7Z075_TRIUA|nr:hypothetical protein TRIUR3_25226 [Triticum urartu]
MAADHHLGKYEDRDWFGDAGQWRGNVAGSAADAHLYDDPDAAAIPARLDSRFHGEKRQAVKSVPARLIEVKKLLHLYLFHHAEK